ncbi:MAG: DNA-3-methyladenine glycosylase [Acidimicrobiia bacterium]|nr:MAG: DNA-3-methyladenine glycosylase [Acidimicrobiia bacterium]
MRVRRRDHPPVRVNESADLPAASRQLAADVERLSSSHELFKRLLQRNGVPPLWWRPASVETLVRFILEQQVSLASANAAFNRLEVRLNGVTAEGVFSSTDDELKADGFSRQKAGYVRGIAEEILAGELDIPALARDGDKARERLLGINGIGPWTAACFALFVSGDRDAWPTGDRALYVSMARNLELADVPTRHDGDRIASEWSPLRSAAAKMLWHDYLGGTAYVPRTDAGFSDGTGKVST